MDLRKLFVLFWLAFGWIVCSNEACLSQEKNLEDRIPKELLSENENLSRLQRELIQVRRGFSKLGKKHPSWASTSERISRLEKQIQQILDQASGDKLNKEPDATPAQPPGGQPPKVDPLPTDNKTQRMQDSKLQGSVNDSVELGDPTKIRRWQTENPLDRWLVNTEDWAGDSRYKGYEQIPLGVVESWDIDAKASLYPLLRTSGLDHFGLFPDGRTVWGVENDRGLGFARVWIWENSKDVRHKQLFWQTDGQIIDVLVPDAFASQGRLYLVIQDVSKTDLRSFQIVSISSPDTFNSSMDDQQEELLVSFSADPRNDLGRFKPRLAVGFSGVKFLTTGIGFSVDSSSKSIFGKQVDPLTYCFDTAENTERVQQAIKRWIFLSSTGDNRAYETMSVSENSIIQREKVSNLETLKIRSWDLPRKRIEQRYLSLDSQLDDVWMAGENIYFLCGDGHRVYVSEGSSNRFAKPVLLRASSSKSSRLFWSRDSGVSILDPFDIESLGTGGNLPRADLEKIDRVSKLGIFKDTSKRIVSDWLIPYEIKLDKSPHGSNLEHYIGLPLGKQIESSLEDGFVFPPGTVFVNFFGQTPVTPYGQEANLDLQLFYKVSDGWIGLRYRWQDDWSDAVLVQSEPYDWVDTKKAQCWECHRAERNEGILGFEPVQLREVTEDDRLQEESLVRIGVIQAVRGFWDGAAKPTSQISSMLPQMRSVLRDKLVGVLTEDPLTSSKPASTDRLFVIMKTRWLYEMYIATGDERLLESGKVFSEEISAPVRLDRSTIDSDGIPNGQENSLLIRSLCSGFSATGDPKMLASAGRLALAIRPNRIHRQSRKTDPIDPQTRSVEFRELIADAESLLAYYTASASSWALEDLRFFMDYLEQQTKGQTDEDFEPPSKELSWSYRYWRLLRGTEGVFAEGKHSRIEQKVLSYLWDESLKASPQGLMHELILVAILQFQCNKVDGSDEKVQLLNDYWQKLQSRLGQVDAFGVEAKPGNIELTSTAGIDIEMILDLWMDATWMKFSEDAIDGL